MQFSNVSKVLRFSYLNDIPQVEIEKEI